MEKALSVDNIHLNDRQVVIYIPSLILISASARFFTHIFTIACINSVEGKDFHTITTLSITMIHVITLTFLNTGINSFLSFFSLLINRKRKKKKEKEKEKRKKKK